MAFLFRAALVIGTLSYFATLRGHSEAPAQGEAASAVTKLSRITRGLDTATLANLSAAWNALPEEARERMTEDGMAELGRRIASAPAVSRDTLAEADRRTAWRGGEGR